MIAKGRNGF